MYHSELPDSWLNIDTTMQASEIEVGVASTAQGRVFKIMSNADIEEHLIAISERD